MKLTLSMAMDNAAFASFDGDNATFAGGPEAARILRTLADAIAADDRNFDAGASGYLRDMNGNTVGRWDVADE